MRGLYHSSLSWPHSIPGSTYIRSNWPCCTSSGSGVDRWAWTSSRNHPSQKCKEKGIDISSQISKQLTDEMLEWADVVVTLGCCSADDLCPVSFRGSKMDWPIEDPLGKDTEVFRKVREDIGKRVKEFIRELLSSGGTG